MHTLNDRKIPCLYVKSASYTYQIAAIFRLARAVSPCMLILEDIDTIVTPSTRSYFFNEVDGLENNDGILMVASTNHLDQLDPGLSKRPSRFDRKYLFPLPSKDERVLYCQYWREKLKDKEEIDFPKKLCGPMAAITDEFSFAYLKEAFVSALLELARNHTEDFDWDVEDEEGHDAFGEFGDLDKYKIWRYFKEQVKLLRDEIGDGRSPHLIAESNGRTQGGALSLGASDDEASFETAGLVHGPEVIARSNIGPFPHRPNVHNKATATSVRSADRLFFKTLARSARSEEEGRELGFDPLMWV